MKIINQKNYSIIEIDHDSHLDQFLNSLNKSSIKEKNLIINVIKSNTSIDWLSEKLLPFHYIWQKRNKSFILVSSIKGELLRDMVVIASLEEAIDFFHMDYLTRNI